MILAGADGTWSDAVRIEIVNGRGEPQRWPMTLATRAAATLQLDAETAGELNWWIAPSDTDTLPRQTYRITARLDTRESSAHGAWRGTAASDSVAITIIDEPAADHDLEAAAQLMASYFIQIGETDRALEVVTELTKDRPNSPGALELQGDVLALLDRSSEALDAYDRAIEILIALEPDAPEPPMELLQKRHTVLDKLIDPP